MRRKTPDPLASNPADARKRSIPPMTAPQFHEVVSEYRRRGQVLCASKHLDMVRYSFERIEQAKPVGRVRLYDRWYQNFQAKSEIG